MDVKSGLDHDFLHAVQRWELMAAGWLNEREGRTVGLKFVV